MSGGPVKVRAGPMVALSRGPVDTLLTDLTADLIAAVISLHKPHFLRAFLWKSLLFMVSELLFLRGE